MVDSLRSQFEKTMQAIRRTSSPNRALELSRAAVRLAAEMKDVDAEWDAREEHVSAAQFSGQEDEGMQSFVWLVSRPPRKGSEYADQWSVLWKYKWISASLTKFASISRGQISRTLDDMEQRFTRNGASLRPVWAIRADIAADLGDKETEIQCRQMYRKARRDDLSDCIACERASEVRFHMRQGHFPRAIRHGMPLLKGILSCSEQPGLARASLLRAFLETGRLEEGTEQLCLSREMLFNGPQSLRPASEHAEYLSATGNHDLAVMVLQRHLRWFKKTPSDLDRFDFLVATLFVLRRASAAGAGVPRQGFAAAWRSTRSASLRDLIAAVEGDAMACARALDARSGNDIRSNMVSSAHPCEKLCRDHPIQ